MPATVLLGPDRRWFVFDFSTPWHVKRFNEAGVHERTIGRRGEGPGEYELAGQGRFLPDGTFEIVDFALNRITALDRDGQVTTTRPVGMSALRIEFLPDGRHVLNARSGDPERIGLPLHVVNRDGDVVRTFGADPPIGDVTNTDLFQRKIAYAGDGTLWSAPLTSYRIERWDTLGTLVEALERDVSWFQSHEDYGVVRDDPEVPPNPGVTGLYLDGRGLLWLMITVADPRFNEALVEGTGPYGMRPMLRVGDYDRYYDTIVEVLDPSQRRIVGHVRLDERLERFASDGSAFRILSEDSGITAIEIWRFRLQDGL